MLKVVNILKTKIIKNNFLNLAENQRETSFKPLHTSQTRNITNENQNKHSLYNKHTYTCVEREREREYMYTIKGES
jgi:hypothetical protein